MKFKNSVSCRASLSANRRRLAVASAICLFLGACGAGDSGEDGFREASAALDNSSATPKSLQQVSPDITPCDNPALPNPGTGISDDCQPETSAEPSAAPGTARLSWDATPNSNVTGYRVYFGTAPGAYDQPPGAGLNVGNSSSYSVADLTRGQTYYFAVTAIDAEGRESGVSDETTRTIP